MSCCGVHMVPMWHRGKLKGWQCVGECKIFKPLAAIGKILRGRFPRHAASKSRKAMRLYET